MFSVRIVNVDHYLSAPLQGLDITYSQFRGSQVKQVPVIRIFGSTPAGIKTCLHIHGVFPYLLIPYDGSDDIQRLMYIIASSLDKALNISLGISNSNKQHVFKIVQVTGSPFYGYHEVEHQFLKIFFYNPSMVKRATDLLQNGAICNKVFQPHEAHVPFILQFFIDYNLYGMSFINLKHVLFRRSVDEQPEINETGLEIPLRMSRCEIEVDAIAMDIYNKLDISEKLAINPGLAAIWEEEKQRKKEENTIFESVDSQPRLNIQPTLSEIHLKDKLRNTLDMQDKCFSLKTNPQSLIPYPLETQEGCDIINASALNIDCITSIVTAKPDNILNESIINEDVILSLTSQSDETIFLNSQDHMLLNVLQNLAEDKEERGEDQESSCKLQYNVEDDSILGSQLLTNFEEEEDLLEACQQVEDIEFQHNTKENTEEQEQKIESWDDNHWLELSGEDIPQIDGAEDLLDKIKPEKHKIHMSNFIEDCEMNREDDDSCSVIEITNAQSATMWPIVSIGKEVDRCDEVFSDSNESINFVERTDADVYENSDVIKINIENNFDHILRGDPSFMSQTIASSEDASFYTSRENFTCAWNNSMSLQPSDNSESDDYLLAKLSDASKPEDIIKSEYTTIVESDLCDITDKNLQFNDNLVPLLNIPECDEIVYNKFVDEVQPIYSDEMIDKTQIMDIFRENVASQSEFQIQNSEEIKNNDDKETTIQLTKPNRMGTLYKKVKDHFSPRKEKSKDVNNIKKIKIKLKFPVKGEIMKSTRKLCFVNRRATLDLSEDYVSNYLRKLEKLKQFYLSRRASGTTKLNVEATKLINNTHILKKKMKVKEAQNSKFVETSFNKYKLRKCFVSLERLQLNSDLSIVKTSTDTIKTNTPKKIINKLEVLQSRPFSTEILKSNILPNSKSEINKTITKNVLGHNKVPVEEVIKREGVKNIFKKKLESQTKCISKKMPSNHNRIKTLENINKMKHSKCIKKSISKDYSIDLDKKKICVKNEKYNHKSFKTNLIDVCRSSTHLNKIDSTQSIFKISNFNESYHDMIDNKLHKINKKNRMLRNTRKENEHYGEENCKDSKILNSRDNIDFVINNKKRSQINNFGMKIETELVSIKYTCNEKKGGNTHDINSFTNMNHVSNNISKQINYPSMENSSMAKSLVSNIDTLHKNAEYMKMGNKTLHRKRNCSKHTKLKNKTEANMMNYSNEIKNKVDYNKRNNAKLNEIEMKTCDNTRNNSEQIKINKKTQINKLDNSKHMKIEKQTQHKKSNHHYDERETKDRKSHNLEYKQIKKEMQFSKSDTTEHKTISSKPNNSQQEELVTKARKVKHRKQYNKKNNSEQIKRDREMQNNKSNNTELLEIGKNTYYNKSINFKHLEIEQKKQDNKINYSNRQEIENKTQDKKSNNLEHRKIKKEIQASKRKSSEHITTSNKSNNCEHKKIETKVQDSTCKSFLEHMELERKTQDKINLSHCQKIEIKSQGEKTNNLEHVKIKIASKRHNPEHTKVDSKSKHKEIEMKTQVKKKKSKLMEIEIKTLDNKSINSQHKEIELKMQDIKGDNSYFKEIENNIQDNKNKNLKHLEIIQKTREKRNNSHHHDIGRKAQDTKSNKSKHANTKNEINSSKRDNSENMTVNSKSNNSQHKEIETKAEDNKSNSEYLEIEMKTRNNYKKNLENMKIEKKSNNSHLEQNKKTQNIKRRHPKYKVLERKAQDNMTNNFEHTSIKQKIQDNKNNISEHMEIENKLQGDMKIRLCKCNKQLQVHYSDAFCEIPLVIETNVINNTEESQIISNNNKQSLFCSASKPLKIPKVSHCKTNERRKRMKLTTIQFLDGTVDSMSSSSDESVDTVKPEVNSDVKRQTPLKKQHPSTNTGTPTRRYERLNIQIKKSPKTDKSAGTATDDCKVNSAIVKLVRNKDIEQMLGIEKPVLQSPSMPENRNLGDLTFKKVIDKSVTGISDNTKMKERHVSHPTEQKSKFSTFKTSKRVSPLVSFTREKKNLRVANPSSDKETASCSGENNPLITSILLSNESETALSKLDQKSVNIVIDKQFVTCVNSVFSSSHELLRPLEETTAVENSNIHRLIKQIKNKEDLELNTPLRKCDRSLPTENNSFAELRVCLRRLSPHLTGVYGEPVPKQKKLMDTDPVDQIKPSDEHSPANQAKSRLLDNSANSKEASTTVSSCKTKVVRKMLNFQSEESDKTVNSFGTLSGSKSSQIDLLPSKDINIQNYNISESALSQRQSLRGRKPSIDLFTFNSSDTQDSIPSITSNKSDHKNTVFSNILYENSAHYFDGVFDPNTSISDDFTKCSKSIRSVESKYDSINKDLNLTLQNLNEDEGILSFYSRTFSEECDSLENSTLNESHVLKNSNQTFNINNLKKISNKYQPMINPPTSSKVKEKLSELGFPEVVNEFPFYSNPNHVGAVNEVGGRTLKLTSRSTADLEDYQGSFNIMSKWQKIKFQEVCGTSQTYKDSTSIISVLASNRKTVITLLKLAPTKSQTMLWIKTKSLINISKLVKEKEKIKIAKISVPLNPEDHSNTDDDNEIISGTPYSENLGVQITPQELDIKLASSDIRTSTPISFNSKELELARTSLLLGKRSGHLSLPPVAEENINTSCDEKSRLNSSYSSQECENSKQASNLSNLLFYSQFRKQFNGKKSIGSMSCQIDAATPDNTGGFCMELENLQQVHPVTQHQYLTTLTMELHVQTRGDLKPDPQYDPICALFYNITNDSSVGELPLHITGAIIVGSEQENKRSFSALRCEFHYVEDEKGLIQEFIAFFHKWDPDILAGFEIEMFSWGYLLQRAYVLAFNLKTQLSRVFKSSNNDIRDQEKGSEQSTFEENEEEIKLTGRIILNVWRFLRHEVALMSYTFENIMYHILHQRVPLFSFRTLSTWWSHRTHLHRWKTAEHYIVRVQGIVKLLEQLDLVGRTSELARLFGIQFYEVLSRGSQFRVESMMLRLAKPLNYVAVSPSVKQRANMRAPETLPLIMEPQSRFYCDPMIVLDFQSLYPSIIIAYNYCYSTCLGRIEHLGQSEIFDFGCTQLKVPLKTLQKLENELNFSPCGVAFVKETVKKGVLPQMLEEILNTRLMVKQSMKDHKNNKTLQRVLHARQLGLKLIANVTYGYTAANFSGRMPCTEVGDSVVSKGRETLERAISLVNQTPKWGAQVVYGDTDSLFVLVPGKNRKDAFRIGAEIAEAVTNSNPKPVKLKLEKVYQPCILQTKKRYVGYMYESPDQEKPTYDAKGIETVRRDGCPAVAKILEKSLRLLFETKDMSLVKTYVTRQFSKIILGRISIQELTFAREYRGSGGYKPGACVPALELARQWRVTDPRAEPRVGERVPHVVVAGPPGLPLIRLVRSPSTLLLDPSLKINSEYYITRVIVPPLDRCFSLLGAMVPSWYAELPRKQFMCLPSTIALGSKKSTISQYFATMNCVACRRLTTVGVCFECQVKPQQLAVALASKLVSWERRLRQVTKLCESCCGRSEGIECISLDCPVLYRKNQAAKDMNQADFVRQLQCEYLTF